MGTQQDPTLGRAYIQKGASGFPISEIDPRSNVQAPSGGGLPAESKWAGGNFVGSYITGNPGRFTFSLETQRNIIASLEDIRRNRIFVNVLALNGCELNDPTSFDSAEIYVECMPSDYGTNGAIVDRTSGNQADLMDTLNMSAGDRVMIRAYAHLRTANSGASAHNAIFPLKRKRVPGICGDYNTGETEFVMASDPIGPATTPNVRYTPDAGATWVLSNVAACADGAAVDITVAGAYVAIACTGTNGGVYWALLSDVKAGSATWTQATGVGTLNVNAIYTIHPARMFAVADGGAIFTSVNGGRTWTTVSAAGALTSENLLSIAGQDENLVWFGGANGTLIKYRNLTTLADIGIAGWSDDGTTVYVPEGDKRGANIFVGDDMGVIQRSRDGGDTWSTLFDGVGRIDSICGAGPTTPIMYFIETNGSSQSRVWADIGGGDMSMGLHVVGSFTDPANSILNCLAPASPNTIKSCGEANGSFGFVGTIVG